MQGINNADQQYQAMIIRMQRLAAGYSGASASGNYEYLTDFTVGAGGGAPANGETEYANPLVTGDIKVHKNGVGYLVEGTDYDVIVGGGFELLIGEFTTGEVYTVFKRNT